MAFQCITVQSCRVGERWESGGVVRLTGAGAGQQIMGNSSVRDDYQLKALKALMISKGIPNEEM